MLSTSEAFQAGFLARCAELGLSAGETEKVAAAVGEFAKQGLLDSIISGAKSLGGGIMSQVPTAGYMAALAPLGLGAAAGYGMGRMTDIDDEDVDSIKQQELIDEYLRNAERLKHRNRRYRPLRQTG